MLSIEFVYYKLNSQGIPIKTIDESNKHVGWKTVAPSEIRLAEGWQTPQELSKNQIKRIITAI